MADRLQPVYPFQWMVNLPASQAGVTTFVQAGGWARLYAGGQRISGVMQNVYAKLRAGQ